MASPSGRATRVVLDIFEAPTRGRENARPEDDCRMRSANVTGQELVDKLRNDELRSVANDLDDDLRDHALKQLDERGSAQELIRQQYTGRYPFELLQNANDALVDGFGEHRALFQITDSSLIVADTGAGFGPEQIRAICRLGRSSKDPRKSIGYKGLGFKSVGEITKRPQIISGDVAFCFDAARAFGEVERLAGPLDVTQRLPVYAFPFALERGDLQTDAPILEGLRREGFRTILRLPFHEGVTSAVVERHVLETVNPRLLLFLDNTDRLEVRGTMADFGAVLARTTSGGATDVLLERSGGHLEHWLIYREALTGLDRRLVDPLGDPWKVVDEVHVAVGVPIAENGTPSRRSIEPLHVYFPTEEATGLPLVLHGDFALELDRRHVGRSPEMLPYNNWLATKLAELVGNVAGDLAERYPHQPSVISCFAPASAASGFGSELVTLALERLRDVCFVPVVGGKSVKPADSLLLPSTLPSVDRAHRLLDIHARPTVVVPAIEIDGPTRSLLSDRLGTSEMDTADAVQLLKEPPTGADTDAYEFLVAWREKEGWRFAQLIRDVPSVRISGGGWVAPAGKVFFPRQRGEIEFPTSLDVPIADIPDVEGLRGLLEAAGVRPFEWRQLLPEFVLPLLRDAGTAPHLRVAALGALRKYYETERTGDPRIHAEISDILVPASPCDVSQGNPAVEMRRARTVYFSSEWLGHDRLEQIYGPFGRAEFLAVPLPSTDEKDTEFAFYEWIGVAPRPRTETVEDAFFLSSLARHPHGAYGDIWQDWQRDVLSAVRTCPHGHSQQVLTRSFALDRFPELVAVADRERLRILWTELATGWSSYDSATRSDVRCDHGWHTTADRSQLVQSFMHYMLTNLSWVPTVRMHKSILVVPRLAWRLAVDTPRAIAERVAVLEPRLKVRESGALIDALKVVDAARPATGDVVALLSQLATDFGQSPVDDRRFLQHAARWAMRTLNDVLEGAIDGPVPLLASHAGEPVFSDKPLVALDPLLKETWEPVLPVLDADQDLRRLHQALHLRILDAEVRVTPEPRIPRGDRQAKIEKWLEQAKPYLAAVAIDQVPSREDDVVRGLARLEVIVCDELVLRYELDGQSRMRDDAVSFISERIVQDGIVRRRFGTAHLELDPNTGAPHWFAFGPQLASFIGVPNLGDAFALLLAATKRDRDQYVASRRVSLEALDTARVQLAQNPRDEGPLLEDLLRYEEAPRDHQDESATSASSLPIPVPPMTLDTTASGNPDDERLAPLPPLELGAVEMNDAPDAHGHLPERERGPTTYFGLGLAGAVDFERQHAVQRLIGTRGEEVAYEVERRRITSLGQDPNIVAWRSKEHELAPYDIESLDEDGQRIYIEVKSTTSSDPYDAFEISEAELLFAIEKRDSYYIYRVTEAHTAGPSVLRFRDPVGRLRSSAAKLRMSGARMTFLHAADDVSPLNESSRGAKEL